MKTTDASAGVNTGGRKFRRVGGATLPDRENATESVVSSCTTARMEKGSVPRMMLIVVR
jgi:hypothetical protein